MVIKFFIVLAVVTACVFGFLYFVPKAEKKIIFVWTLKILLAFAFAAIVIATIIFLGNF